MSLEEQQATDTSTDSTDSGRDLTTELTYICTAWLIGALLAGVAFVAFSDVFAGLV